MKKVILGSFIFLAGILSAAFILAGSLANDLMINGQHSSIWIISQYGLLPALAVFLCMAIAGLVLAIWGLFNQDDKNNF